MLNTASSLPRSDCTKSTFFPKTFFTSAGFFHADPRTSDVQIFSGRSALRCCGLASQNSRSRVSPMILIRACVHIVHGEGDCQILDQCFGSAWPVLLYSTVCCLP